MVNLIKSNPRTLGFFPEKKRSKVVYAGGPSQREQLTALITNQYWTVLNAHLFHCSATIIDSDLQVRVNAFKHLLQVYGSRSDKLPDYRPNTGGAYGHIFHGHVKDSQGTTFVIEWSVIDTETKQIAITHFDKHENFPFKQTPLKPNEIQGILTDPFNVRMLEKVKINKDNALKKCERIEKNYRNSL